MQGLRQESVFSDFINEEVDLEVNYPRRPSVDARDRNGILQNVIQAVESIRGAVATHEHESYWIGQLLAYLLRLQGSEPAHTADEQFRQLYALRKWLFWMPVALLQQQGGQGPAMLVLAHFYATALALEPLFPDLGPFFCARFALTPLDIIIGVTNDMQTKHGYNQSTSMEIASLMQYPRQAAMNFRTRRLQTPPTILPSQPQPLLDALDVGTLAYSTIGNLSPAFAPAPLSYVPEHSSSSSFLDVPQLHGGSAFGTPDWSTAPSPQHYTSDLYSYSDQTGPNQEMFDYGMATFDRGFVPTTPIWA